MLVGSHVLRHLQIGCLRNIRCARVELDAQLVVVGGLNGAGKTTVLEAVYLLARGRSFRGRKAGPITTLGEAATSIKGLTTGTDGAEASIVLRRDPTGVTRRRHPPEADGEQTELLPLKLVGENAQALIDGEPSLRRRFMDLGMFHVEPGFGSLRRSFHRVLLQRNAAIRSSGPRGASAWDGPFVELGDELDRRRHAFSVLWNEHFSALIRGFASLDGCRLTYHRGWKEEEALSDALARTRSGEQVKGYTQVGPQRADLTICRQGVRVPLSRGQAKLVVCLMQLALERAHRELGRGPAIWLLDDLDSELDEQTGKAAWELFLATGSQIIATRASGRKGRDSWMPSEARMFHVEQGSVSSVIPDRPATGLIPT